MDPGKENNNGKVIQFITSNNLRRTLGYWLLVKKVETQVS